MQRGMQKCSDDTVRYSDGGSVVAQTASQKQARQTRQLSDMSEMRDMSSKSGRKSALSNVDIAVIVEELQDIVGARIDKIYQIGEEIWIKLRVQLEGKRLYSAFGGSSSVDLVIERGCRIHLTKYKREAPKTPTPFAMFLRKYLSGGRIVSIRQIDFDRIVEICVERASCEGGCERRYLIAEILPRGNLLLTDSEGRIMRVMEREVFATRELKSGVFYERPPSKWNPISASEDDLKQFFRALCEDEGESLKEEENQRGERRERGEQRGEKKEGKKEGKKKRRKRELVRALAMQLGGLYAEEICARAGVRGDKNIEELSDDDIKAIYDAMIQIFEPIKHRNLEKVNAHIVIKDGEAVDVLPFPLRKYEECDKQFFTTFNDAVDEYFTRISAKRMQETAVRETAERVEKLEKVLKEQEEALKRFLQEEEACRRKAELIYARYEEVERALEEARAERKKVVKLKLSDGGVEEELTLDTSLSPFSNASRYYERAKALKKKRIGVEKAIEETKKKIEEARRAAAAVAAVAESQQVVTHPIPKKKAVGKWYEKFRWTFTSHGFLVVGGKDASSNEVIVKKHMDDDDLFFHTQAEGAPAVILKTEGREVPEEDLEEAAQFAASYSSLWKLGFYGGECYCVSATQVSKTPPHGEYIKKGSFIVRGKRRYFKVELSLSVGIAGDAMRKLMNDAETQRDNAESEERSEEQSEEQSKEKQEVQKVVACPKITRVRNPDMLKYWVDVVPGDVRKEKLARRIIEILKEEAKKHGEDVEISIDELIRILPPGNGAIASRKR